VVETHLLSSIALAGVVVAMDERGQTVFMFCNLPLDEGVTLQKIEGVELHLLPRRALRRVDRSVTVGVMAYFLEALVFRAVGIEAAGLPAEPARIVPLSPQIALVPLTDEVLEAARSGDSPARDGTFAAPLPPRIETWARRQSQRSPVGYIVAEYFGGDGGQFSIVWSGGEIVLGPLRQSDAINQALRLLGIASADGLDEFDTIGLGRHRHTHEWV
jgi:hypothetical protein